ncbi:MAG: fumarylacetoacetate hydrolase family protein [Pseudomonadales bacterium]
MDTATIKKTSQRLHECLRQRTTMAPLTEEFSDISIDDAYQISRGFLALRQQDGEKIVGKKIGVTSAPVQEALGVYQPDFGFLTDAMLVKDGKVNTSELIAPRAEAEIAFRLKEGLRGPGITPEDVLQATEAVIPCFEIVDSRIKDWKIKIQDTIADNASCGVFVLGDEEADPADLDLPSLRVEVHRNGSFLSEGVASSVQGAPQNALAWLANTLGEYGIPFEAGELVLSGSLVPLEPAVAGDLFTMNIAGLGGAQVRFV